MKTLPETFRSGGFEHTLERREGDVAVYRRQRIGLEDVHYEVVRIKSHNGFTIAGKTFPPAETYPTSEEWGTRGWTFNDEAKAKAKFSLLA